jgi:hypothetical protein
MIPKTPAICAALIDPLDLRKQLELKDKRILAYRKYLAGLLTIEEYAIAMAILVSEEVDPLEPDG